MLAKYYITVAFSIRPCWVYHGPLNDVIGLWTQSTNRSIMLKLIKSQ